MSALDHEFRTLANVAFRLECGCLWRLGRGGAIPAVEVLPVGSARNCWNGHGEQSVTEVRAQRTS